MMKHKSNIDVEKYRRDTREKWAQEKALEAEAREIQVRKKVAQRGYRLMHRRNGQYWVMFDQPMTLPEIETWVGRRRGN
jgi:hypothetical protein